MTRRKQPPPEAEHWSITTNEYRIGIGVLFMLLLGLLTWLGNGIIGGQSQIRTELEAGNTNLTTLRGELNALRIELTGVATQQKGEIARLEGSIRDLDSRLTRTNERQTDQAASVTRIETLMSTFKK